MANALDQRMTEHLARLQAEHAVTRLWQRDSSLFSADVHVQKAIRDRLGWLFHIDAMRTQVERLAVLARVVARLNFDRVLVVGMGGSSLWPEVLGKHLKGKRGLPIRIIDSTHPEAIADVIAWGKQGQPLFVIATKSGGTIETISTYRALRQIWNDGGHFLAITDPGSSLEALAQAEGFRDTFLNPSDIGGRFSAGTLFGLVPAALAGVVLHDALDRMADVLESCHDEDLLANPGAQLGAFLAAAHDVGRWQLRLALGPDVNGFGAWIEQLIAESTGKLGNGLLPMTGELPESGDELAAKMAHAVVVGLTTFAAPDQDFLTRAIDADVPSQAYVLPEVADLWTEVVRWEAATAFCGMLLGINPFDEPDVSAAKAATAGLLNGTLQPVAPDRALTVRSLTLIPDLMADELAALTSDDYLAVLAWMPGSAQNQQRLEKLRQALQARTGAAVVVQIGPRYLHSTGQFHKGGIKRGNFLFIDDFSRLEGAVPDIAIPGQPFGFATLVRAQADGDVAVLKARGKPVWRVRLEFGQKA
jgi:glucose-6-phosphate isomerase